MTTPITIRFGTDQSLELDIPPDALIAQGGTPSGVPVSDVAAAVAAALATPNHYPALADATLSSDRICVAVEQDVPQVANVISGVLQPLFAADVPPEQITVVLAEEYPRGPAIAEALPEAVREKIRVTRHDSRDANGLSYLAATADGDPIQINRHICDADVVIPISSIRAEDENGDWGQRGNVFPTFADAHTREKYVTPWAALSQVDRERRKRGREEAAWLLGARLTLQIVSGGSDTVLHAVAGDVDSVGLRTRELAMQAWGINVPRKAALVVASLDGENQQTWENVSRAISAALRVVADENSAIAICTELAELPGPSMIRAMLGVEEDYDEEDAGEMHASSESLAGGQLRQTLEQMPLYLLSRLSEDVVLELGMAYVEQPSDLNNLCQRYESCVVLNNAQHVLPTMSREASAESMSESMQ